MMHPSRLTHHSAARSGGFLAMYNLMSAAAAAGVNRSTCCAPSRRTPQRATWCKDSTLQAARL